jgi:phage terminase large subunit-like protein
MRSILDVKNGPLQSQFLPRDSWHAWDAFHCATFGLQMSEQQRAMAMRCTGRSSNGLETPAREAWMVVGRRGGKSRNAALLAVYLGCFRRYALAPGERGVVMVIAADRRQARIMFRYIRALIESAPMLASMVIGRPTKDAIHLTNAVTIEVHTASYRAVRGYTVVAAVCDEIAFWPNDDAANPDHEILAALRPAMATIPNALLIALSSPYSRRGELWNVYRDHF